MFADTRRNPPHETLLDQQGARGRSQNCWRKRLRNTRGKTARRHCVDAWWLQNCGPRSNVSTARRAQQSDIGSRNKRSHNKHHTDFKDTWQILILTNTWLEVFVGDGSAPIREGRHCRGTGGQGDGDLFRPYGQLSSETTRRVEASEWCTPRDRIPGDKIWTIKFKTCHDDCHFQKKRNVMTLVNPVPISRTTTRKLHCEKAPLEKTRRKTNQQKTLSKSTTILCSALWCGAYLRCIVRRKCKTGAKTTCNVLYKEARSHCHICPYPCSGASERTKDSHIDQLNAICALVPVEPCDHCLIHDSQQSWATLPAKWTTGYGHLQCATVPWLLPLCLIDVRPLECHTQRFQIRWWWQCCFILPRCN